MSKKDKSSKIVPLGDRVLLEAIEGEKKTTSGIILTAHEEKGMKEGKVLAIGEGKIVDGQLQEIQSVKVGDVVLFQWGDEIKVDGKEYFLVRENEISAIIS